MSRKGLRRIAGVIALYVFLGLSLEASVAVVQPRTENTVVLRTFDATGASQDRVVTLLADGADAGVSDPALSIASGRWFRRWYARLHHNPNVQVDRGEGFVAYRASGEIGPEDRRRAEERMGRGRDATFWLRRAVHLFAPIKPVRLEPVDHPTPP